MKLLTLSLLTIPLCAQVAITQGPYLGQATITRSSASIAWATNVPADTQVYWSSVSADAVNPASCVAPVCNASIPIGGYNAPILIHNWYTFGTPGGRTIWFKVCSTASNQRTCSAVGSYTSASQPVVPAEPAPPTPVDSPPVPTGTVRTVGANCDDPNTGLVAMWNRANRGDIVEIDPTITPYCAGAYTFPAKPPGPPHILTRVKNAATTFPNYRRANLGDLPTAAGFAAGTNKMARFIHSAPDILQLGPGDPANSVCFAGDRIWRAGQANAWAMYRCNNVNPQAITAIPSSGNLNLTVPAHQIPEGSMAWVSGVTGAGAATVNGSWKIHVVDVNTVQLHPYIDSGAIQATGAASGGTISLNRYQLEPVTEGTANPPTMPCTFGTWYHLKAGTGTADEYHRTWYCDGPNEWIQLRMDPNYPNVNTFPVIDIVTNKLDHLMFQGLSFEPMHLAASPLTMQYKYLVSSGAGGTLYYSFIAQSIYNDHIYWDNILAGAPDPSPAGEMERLQNICWPCDGTNIHFGGGYFYGAQVFRTLQEINDGSEQEAAAFQIFQGGPYEFVNNYIACAGICVYVNADQDLTTDFHDLLVKQNTIETPDKYWKPSGPLLTQGMYFTQRHRFELKRAHRVKFEGNIFTGGWVSVNQAAGHCLCYRTDQGVIAQSLTDNGTTTTVQGYEPNPSSPGWMFTDIAPNDYITFISAPYAATGACTSLAGKIYQVISVSDFTHFTIPTTGCNAGWGAQIMRLNPRTGNISDILIQNQTWLNNPTDVAWLGHDSYPFSQGPILQRVKLNNNLSVGLDGLRVGRGSYFSAPQVAPSGSHLNLVEGGEDLIDVHETVIGRTENYYESGDYGNGGAAAASGLLMANNIFEYLSAGGSGGPSFSNGRLYGIAFFNSEWSDLSGTAPNWTFSQNVILRKGGCGKYQLDPCSGPPWGPYPSGALWYDTESAPFPFVNAAQHNYRLNVKSLYASGGKQRSVDALDIGVNVDVLEAARGDVSNVRAIDIKENAATVAFLAPDGVGCPVDWSVDKFATFTRVANSGGSRTQTVPITGLPAHTAVSFRVNCTVMQPAGTFTTN